MILPQLTLDPEHQALHLEPSRAAAPSSSSSTPHYYHPELDALRLCAFLMVFFYHANMAGTHVSLRPIFLAGSFGLPIFFVLSAYLIMELLLREWEHKGSIHLRYFYLRRILRIWPLYCLGIVISFVVGHFLPLLAPDPKVALYFAAMLANLYILREHHFIRGTAFPLWSISLEEQFYLIAPFLMKLGPALVTGFAVLALAGAYICLGFLPHRYLACQSVAWVNSFVQFQFFSAGLLLAALLHKRDFRAPVVARVFLLAVSTALYLLAAGPLGIKDTTPIHTSQLVSGYAAVLVGTVCVFLAFYNLPYRIPRLITYLGSISFGLYVFHSVWIDTLLHAQLRLPFGLADNPKAVVLLALLLTVLSAMLSYHFFEKPILRLKKRFQVVPTR